jgi:hypothetical protein
MRGKPFVRVTEMGTDMSVFSDLIHFVEVFGSKKLEDIVVGIAMNDIRGPCRVTQSAQVLRIWEDVRQVGFHPRPINEMKPWQPSAVHRPDRERGIDFRVKVIGDHLPRLGHFVET